MRGRRVDGALRLACGHTQGAVIPKHFVNSGSWVVVIMESELGSSLVVMYTFPSFFQPDGKFEGLTSCAAA